MVYSAGHPIITRNVMRRPLDIYIIALNTTQLNFSQTANTFHFGEEFFFFVPKTNIMLSRFGLTSFFDF